MGHTRAQLLHFIWHVELTNILRYFEGNAPFFGVAQDERVPMGQNEHQVRGAYINDRVTPTIVVMRIIIQNTRPIAFQSPQA